MPLSQSLSLRIIAGATSFLALGFGLNALLRPRKALELFEFDVPATAYDQKVVDGLLVIYGARDIVMFFAILSTAYYGHRKALGWILVSIAGVAGVDGWVVKEIVGHGEWTHWGYAPMLGTLGALLLGALDKGT